MRVAPGPHQPTAALPPTPDEISLFSSRGRLVRRGLLDSEQLALLGSHLHRVGVVPASDTPAARRDVVQVPGGAARDTGVLSLLREAGVGALAAALLGASEIRLLQDAVLLKAARSPGRVEWHRDYTYLGYLTPARIASVRIALTPSVGTGALHVLDGSHRWEHEQALDLFAGAIAPAALDELPEPWRTRARDSVASLELEAGDATVHHCLTWHGSFANTTASDQVILVCHVFDAACTLDPDKLPVSHRELFVTDDQRRLVGEAFPLL